MAGAVELYIGDIDYSDRYRRTSLALTEALRVEGNTMNFTIVGRYDDDWPIEGQYVKAVQDGVILFAGRIGEGARNINGDWRDFAVDYTCVDFTVDFDRHLIQHNFPAQLAGDSVRELTGLVGFGFSSLYVEDGAPVAAYESDLEYPSAIMSRLGDSIEFNWYIDYDRVVHFFYIKDREAPVVEIDFDSNIQDFFELSDSASWTQVKNVIYLRGVKAKSTDPYDHVLGFADGDTRFFALAYEPWDINSTTITVDAVPVELLFDGIDGRAGDANGVQGQAYLCMDNWGVRFPDAVPAPGSGGAAGDPGIPIGGSYNYSYDPVVRVDDPESIQRMYEIENHVDAPSDGIHELLFNVPEMRVESETAIVEYGYLLLYRYTIVPRMLTFESLTQGWLPGQHFRGYSVVRSFDETFYIHGVSKRLWYTQDNEVKWIYTITASNSPFPG